MRIATNLPDLPTENQSKFKESMRDTVQFVKSLCYLTKKIFML